VDTPEIPRDGPFGDVEAQLQKFSVDFRCAPAGILFGHSADKRAGLVGDFGPTTARSRTPAPVEAKTGAVPTDDSLGLHDYEGGYPTRAVPADDGLGLHDHE
jgi:hypothetical protein